MAQFEARFNRDFLPVWLSPAAARVGLKSKRFAEKIRRVRLNLKVLATRGAAPAACNAL
jgi:hypothetical protein